MKEIDDIVPDLGKQKALISQLVVGHQQYQRAINADEHFRRAFSEVFRRRSLLFIGSGILEDYLVNLFSEIIYHHGPGPYPHFALVSIKESNRFDSSFLQSRLGIIPVFYKDHSELPGYLDALADQVNFWPGTENRTNLLSSDVIHHTEIGFTLAANVGSDSQFPFKISINKSALPLPSKYVNECSVVSVGRENDIPKSGKLATSHLLQAVQNKWMDHISVSDWLPLDEKPSYVFQYRDLPIFAIAARSQQLKASHHDRRDLAIIPDAVKAALVQIDKARFESVLLGPIASGTKRPWHPIHPFAQTLRGIRLFLRTNSVKNIKRIAIYVIDQAVWYPIVAGKVPVTLLLSSDLSNTRIELKDSDGNSESFVVTQKRVSKAQRIVSTL